jgi:RimJ/RimL family protein N-acetyltransferase
VLIKIVEIVSGPTVNIYPLLCNLFLSPEKTNHLETQITGIDFGANIVLENERAMLEPLAAKHLAPLKQIIAKDNGLLQYSTIKVEAASDLDNYFALAVKGREAKERYAFAIFDKATKAYAGTTSFAFPSDKDKRVEIGYTWIGYDHQRTGLNTAMKGLMLQYAFEQLGFMRVELRADSRNTQSRKAMERIGATYEGELREHMVLPDGYRRSSVYFSILADEWPHVKKERFSNGH